MANKPPDIKITGIRGAVPPGYLLGRVSPGNGDVELISMQKAQSVGLIPSKLPPSGPAGGDLGGTYPNPTVVGWLGRLLSIVAPTDGQVMHWVAASSRWVAYTILGLTPAGGTTGQVLTKINGTDYNYDWETPAGSSGAPASIQDDGTNILLALSDSSGQLVLDGSGNPIFSTEVFPVAAIPALPYTSSTLSSANILVGNAGNIATAVAMSGDATITNAGVVAIKNSVTLAGNPTTTTQATGDSSTRIATTAFTATAIANAIAGVNPAVAVNAATTAASNTSALTYNNGVAGVGATLTGANNVALTVDGFTFTTLGQRLLVKNDTQSPSGAFNGVYYVTQVQATLLPLILTRALDYDMASDINNTGAIPVKSGTANALTSWLLTSLVTTVGTDPLTYVEFSFAPTFANPTATASDVAVNGSATTFMRSDAAPAVQKTSSSVFGLAKVDNFSIGAVAGVIGTLFGGFVAQLTANQNVTLSTFTKVIFDTFITNTLGTQYSTTTGIFTPTKAGRYLVFAFCQGATTTVGQQCDTLLSKNGTFGTGGTNVGVGVAGGVNGGGSTGTAPIVSIVAFNGTTDTLEVDLFVNGTGGFPVAAGGGCLFGAIYLGP